MIITENRKEEKRGGVGGPNRGEEARRKMTAIEVGGGRETWDIGGGKCTLANE